MIDRAWRTDMVGAFATVTCGAGLDEPPPRRPAAGAGVCFIRADLGELVGVSGVEDARALEGVIAADVRVTPSDRTQELLSSSNRAVSVYATPSTAAGALAQRAALTSDPKVAFVQFFGFDSGCFHALLLPAAFRAHDPALRLLEAALTAAIDFGFAHDHAADVPSMRGLHRAAIAAQLTALQALAAWSAPLAPGIAERVAALVGYDGPMTAADAALTAPPAGRPVGVPLGSVLDAVPAAEIQARVLAGAGVDG